MGAKILRQVIWYFTLLGLLLLCLWLSFQTSVLTDYYFRFFYDLYDINAHIQTYAPQNYIKYGFETLNYQQHIHLFSQIVDAVHNQGLGLADIYYFVGDEKVPLLTSAEIIHLNDVSILITRVNTLALFILPVTLFCFVWLLHKKHYPNWYAQIISLFITSLFTVLILYWFGFEAVFYKLHHWVFPDNHQWFFYYQESLMSTLMKAPDLFAGIACAILVPALLLFFMCLGFLVLYPALTNQPVRVALNFASAKFKRGQVGED